MPLDTDRLLIAFLGENGAGKSTFAMALIYALMPDRRVLNVRPISDIKDPSMERQDSLFGRIDPETGYAYVAFDISARDKRRLIAGVHFETRQNRVDLTPFSIEGLAEGFDLFEVFNVPDGDEVYTPDLAEMKRHLARKGFDCHTYDRVGDYGKLLHDAGISPTPMYANDDRELYARLLETSFLGGISPEVAKNLKHYILPEARHIPDTVRRLHECTEDVLRTQRALSDAKRQIRLIQAAYVTGRSLVANALSYVRSRFSNHWRDLEALRQSALAARAKKTFALASNEQQQKELAAAIDGERSAKELSKGKIKALEGALASQRAARLEAEASSKEATESYSLALIGKEKWGIAAKKRRYETYDDLETSLKVALKALAATQARIGEDIRRLKEDLACLQRPDGSSRSIELAGRLQAQTLGQALAHVSDGDALAFEAALHGLTDGVVGVPLSALAAVEPCESLPDCFWMGSQIPEVGGMEKHGAWYALPSLGGFTVVSEAYKASFGYEARQQRAAALEEQIAGLEKALETEYAPQETELMGRQTVLLENSTAIKYYLTHRDSLATLAAEANSAKILLDECDAAIKETEDSINDEHEDLASKLSRYAGQRETLRVSMARADAAIVSADEALITLAARKKGLFTALRAITRELRSCRSFLAIYPFFATIPVDPHLSDPATYVGRQGRSYAELTRALDDESPERIQPILALEIDQHSPTECLTIWPVLMAVLHDHVPSTLLETEGEELLHQMEARRDRLLAELGRKQAEVKVQAKNISASINNQINWQKRQVNVLSEMGRDLRFGKVEGIRISLTPKERMIDVLQKVADDDGLFKQDAGSMEEVLSNYFKEALGVRLSGTEILDYRSFIDLSIEAKRKSQKDWFPAFSLSGGEAIGAGVAIVLMLFKALAARGDHRADQLTPIFVMDEINRIDPRGQKMVVEFCERNAVQLFVTGPEMVPAQQTKMYMMARSFVPEECVIPRELRGFAG
ncbi:MAG: hypothetical protein ACM31P_13830 [Actinomycetota bacterium]